MASNETCDLLTAVADYYSAKLAEHGDTPQGVDWNGKESQILRFEQLTKVIAPGEAFSLNDIGCGYGALYDYLRERYPQFSYTGCDVAEDMVAAAQSRTGNHANARYLVGSQPPRIADYGVTSGIFNVRLERTDSDWRSYIETTLDVLDRTSLRGFAFNCLTYYSDADKMRDYLYYADPCSLFDYCKKRYSRNVALLHDYGLYEFTILVRKDV